MQGSATPNTAATTTVPHQQGQVVGSQIHYGGGGSGINQYLPCCASPIWDRRTRTCAALLVFFFVLSMLNFIFGIIISGLIFFGFFVVLLVCFLVYYSRLRTAMDRASAMQTVHYNQVPHGGVIVIQAQGAPAGQPHPVQHFTHQPHPPQGYQTQSQPYPPQQYPPQAYSTQIYPPQYPQPSSPSPAHPSYQTLPGDKQPIAEGGVTPASTGDTTHPQPGGASGQAVSGNVPASSGSGPTSLPGSDIPPPPSYNEAMGIGSNNRLQ